jgi:hypothetical protein
LVIRRRIELPIGDAIAVAIVSQSFGLAKKRFRQEMFFIDRNLSAGLWGSVPTRFAFD